MNGNVPQLSGDWVKGCFWSGQPYWTYQAWVRFSATIQCTDNAITIFQQTPAGHYGANFSIDSIVIIPTFTEPSRF